MRVDLRVVVVVMFCIIVGLVAKMTLQESGCAVLPPPAVPSRAFESPAAQPPSVVAREPTPPMKVPQSNSGSPTDLAATPPSQVQKPLAEKKDIPAPSVSVPSPSSEVAVDHYEAKVLRIRHLQTKCPLLRTLRSHTVSSACDICELLPLLEAYSDEVDRVTEAGSRHGRSTSALLNRHVVEFSSMEIDVQPPLAKLHQYYDRCTQEVDKALYPVSAHQIVVGDDVIRGVPYNSTPFLFLDTIHNADQLYKELEVMSIPTTQWITFHDSYSFKDREEGPRIRRKDVPAVVSQWKGLSRPITHFLEKYHDEWLEEMNYIHCNGFFVVRRRSFTPSVLPPSPKRADFYFRDTKAFLSQQGLWKEDFELSSTTFAEKSFVESTLLKVGVQTRSWSLSVDRCEEEFKAVTGIGSGWLCTSRRPSNPSMRLYGALVAAADYWDLLSRIGVIFGYGWVGEASFIVGPSADEGFPFGVSAESNIDSVKQAGRLGSLLEVASLFAAGASRLAQKGKTLRVQVLGPKSLALVESIRINLSAEFGGMDVFPIDGNTFSKLDGQWTSESSPFTGAATPPAPANTVFVSARLLRLFSPESDFGALSRIVVFGTALHDATSFAPKGFELKTVLNQATGIAVWEKVGSVWGHYYKGKGTGLPIVEDVPRKEATFAPIATYPLK